MAGYQERAAGGGGCCASRPVGKSATEPYDVCQAQLWCCGGLRPEEARGMPPGPKLEKLTMF